jgi:hypothetical protein
MELQTSAQPLGLRRRNASYNAPPVCVFKLSHTSLTLIAEG